MHEIKLPPHYRLQSVLKDPKSFATTLFTVFYDYYGDVLDDQGRPACLFWAPATIKREIEEDFNLELPDRAFDRLMTAILLVTTNRFNTSLPDFIECCNILSGDSAATAQFDPADLQEIAWGLTEWYLLVDTGEDLPENEVSREIRAYIGAMMDNEGLVKAPDVLRLAIKDTPINNTIDGFQDDPVMYEAIYRTQLDKTADLEETIRESLQALLDQLSNLPLQNGSTQHLREKVIHDRNRSQHTGDKPKPVL